MYKFRINSIHCVSQKDTAKGKADIWILAQSDGGAPVRFPPAALSSHAMGDGDTWNLDDDGGLTIEYDGCCNLTLYEQDFEFNINGTDFMGCARFTAGADPSSDKVATNGSDPTEGDYSEFSINFSQAS